MEGLPKEEALDLVFLDRSRKGNIRQREHNAQNSMVQFSPSQGFWEDLREAG